MAGSGRREFSATTHFKLFLVEVIVEVVTRRGCHLCEEAIEAVRQLGFEPQLRDVDDDAELFRLYDFRVPVILLNGRPVAEGRVDPRILGQALGRGSDRGET